MKVTEYQVRKAIREYGQWIDPESNEHGEDARLAIYPREYGQRGVILMVWDNTVNDYETSVVSMKEAVYEVCNWE